MNEEINIRVLSVSNNFAKEHKKEIDRVLHENKFFSTVINDNYMTFILSIIHENNPPTIEGIALVTKKFPLTLHSFCISNKYKGQQIGKNFYNLLEQSLNKIFYEMNTQQYQICLTSSKNNEGFYKKLGFVQSGTFKSSSLLLEEKNRELIFFVKNINLEELENKN